VYDERVAALEEENRELSELLRAVYQSKQELAERLKKLKSSLRALLRES